MYYDDLQKAVRILDNEGLRAEYRNASRRGVIGSEPADTISAVCQSEAKRRKIELD